VTTAILKLLKPGFLHDSNSSLMRFRLESELLNLNNLNTYYNKIRKLRSEPGNKIIRMTNTGIIILCYKIYSHIILVIA